jgi:hypothetical protein
MNDVNPYEERPDLVTWVNAETAGFFPEVRLAYRDFRHIVDYMKRTGGARWIRGDEVNVARIPGVAPLDAHGNRVDGLRTITPTQRRT